MSVTTQQTVWCDACSQWEQMSGKRRDVLTLMKQQGWRRTSRGGVVRDYCPKCVESVEAGDAVRTE